MLSRKKRNFVQIFILREATLFEKDEFPGACRMRKVIGRNQKGLNCTMVLLQALATNVVLDMQVGSTGMRIRFTDR